MTYIINRRQFVEPKKIGYTYNKGSCFLVNINNSAVHVGNNKHIMNNEVLIIII